MASVSTLYDINNNYFKTIDSPEKAYVLGFIASDGYNSNKGFTASIQNKDVEVLEFIRTQIGKDVPIKRNNYTPNVSVIGFYRKSLSDDLNNLGITKAKSKTLQFPELNENLISHFLRGVFDGDGSVYLRNYKDGRSKQGIILSYVSASEEFINRIREILKNKCNLKDIKIHKHNKTDAFYLNYQGSNVVKKIFEFIYKDSCFHLNRKFDRFKTYYN